MGRRYTSNIYFQLFKRKEVLSIFCFFFSVGATFVNDVMLRQNCKMECIRFTRCPTFINCASNLFTIDRTRQSVTSCSYVQVNYWRDFDCNSQSNVNGA